MKFQKVFKRTEDELGFGGAILKIDNKFGIVILLWCFELLITVTFNG